MNKPANPTAPLMTERRVGLLGGMLVAVGPVSMALYTPAMPEIAREFAASDSAVKLTLTTYFFGFAFAQLFCGPLSDGFGRKPVSIAFMVIYAIASLLAVIAPTIEVLVIARLLQGIGASVGVAISRAIVRDCFTGEKSARIMNLIGIVLAIGPAVAPTVGGLILIFSGWHAIFLLMLAIGVAAAIVISALLVETVTPDLSRVRPLAFAKAYATLFTNRRFMSASIAVAGTLGCIYAQAPLLPFLLMGKAGLTPLQFGAGMLAQSGSYLVASLVARRIMTKTGADRLVPVGLAFCIAAGLLIAVLMRSAPVTYLTVMGPVALLATGIALILPAMMTNALQPHPTIAGAASAMLGFTQMGAGMAGSGVAAIMDDPAIAMGPVIPVMIAIATLSYWVYRRETERSVASARA
jgi:DHA1 family bicyclomycin/chloramphenicol resistance-like MFS transporter